MSSASPGVKSRPSVSGFVPAQAMPVLSQPLENQILTESSIPTLCNSISTEEITTPSNWEEDYQDLSNWCMDTFKNHCIFHIDESNTSIHSGIHSGDRSMSSDIVRDVTDTGGIDDKSIVITIEETLQNRNCQTKSLLVDKKKENMVKKKIDVLDAWSDLPQSSLAAKNHEWIPFLKNPNKTEAYPPIPKIADKNVYTPDNRQEHWDVINAGPDTFDLLSYVCDDTVQLPETISTEDLEKVSGKKAVMKNTRESCEIMTRLRSRKKIKVVGHESQSRTVSTVTSPMKTKYSAELSSSSMKPHTMTIKKKMDEAPYAARQKKRTIDSDSDDHSSSHSYKESREKNNEASRKSRMNKKAKETKMMDRAEELEKNNRLLKMKVEQLDKMVTSMRAVILRSALMKRN